MSKYLDQCLADVTARLEELAGWSPAPAIKGSEIHRFRTISTPLQRKVVKQGYSFIGPSRAENLAVWDYIWHNTAYQEVMNQALYFYQHQPGSLNRQETTRIRGWARRCQCWEHSDDLAKMYADVVEDNPDWMLPTLEKWNRSRNPWYRRMSMTSLIEYASKRENVLPYDELMAFVLPLIDDDEFYVQKGLGWTVREIGNVYPGEIGGFMREYASRLSPQAWTGATKNMGKADKARLMKIRKRGA